VDAFPLFLQSPNGRIHLAADLLGVRFPGTQDRLNVRGDMPEGTNEMNHALLLTVSVFPAPDSPETRMDWFSCSPKASPLNDSADTS